jgi:hypothetical protein
MSTYRITNITNTAGKRDFKHNSILDIEYIDDMSKKVIKIKPGDSMFLTTNSLPLSVHRLRVKGLITVVEISAVELANALESLKPKTEKKKPTSKKEEKKKVISEEEKFPEIKESTSGKKKYVKKDVDEEHNDSKQD